MNNQTVRLVRGDTGPDRVITLYDAISGLPVDLTGFDSAQMYFRKSQTTTLLATLPLTLLDATAGTVLLVWGPTTLDVVAGLYEGEVEVTVNSKVITAFQTLRFQVREQFA